MSDQLISREALKEHKFLTPQVKVIGGRHSGKLKEQIIQAYQKGWNDCIDAIIDNAPTVETYPFEQVQELVKLNQQFAQEIENLKRPQGEWVDTGSGQECNVCHEIQYGYDNFRHFCANCGADMRKGGAE